MDLGATGKRSEPVSRDAAPLDSPSTAADSVEHAPGASGLEAVLGTLAENWREDAPSPEGCSDSEELSFDEPEEDGGQS